MSEANQVGWVSLGIDVAKAKFDVALLQPDKLTRHTFAMDATGYAALARWVRHHGAVQVHACLEATGEYGAALALFLYEAGYRVSLVNPARIAAYAKSRLARTKTDRADAALIAHFCQTQQPLPWTPPAAEVRELQALVRRVEMLQELAQQEGNRLQRGIPSPAVLASIETTLAFLRAEIAKSQRFVSASSALRQRLVQEQLERSAELKHQQALLRSIPGVDSWRRFLASIPGVGAGARRDRRDR
jgi:transposase